MPYCLITDEVPQPSETPLKALFRHALDQPDRIALIAGDDVWTYGRLAIDVARLSRGLRRHGILPGDRIGMVVRMSPIYAVFMFAAMLTGAIIAPLEADFTANEMNELLRVLQPAFLVYEADLHDLVSGVDPGLLGRAQIFRTEDVGARSWRHLLDEASRKDVAPASGIDEICLLLATSGKTSKPKLVAYSQRAISHMAGAAKSWAVDQDACVIGTSPVAHVSGTFIMLVTIIGGHTEVLLHNCDADTVLDVIEHHRGTTMFVAPFICMPLVEAQRKRPRNVRSLRFCAVGGHPCRPHVAEAFESTFDIELEYTYDLTECVGSTAFGYDRRALRGIPGRTRLVGADGEPAAHGSVGELQVRGPNLSLGYWTDPGNLVSHTHDGWFSTGDLMLENADRDYRFIGRCRDLIGREADSISSALSHR